MNGLLVRVAADQSPAGGGWNGPVDGNSFRFVYVPILEHERSHPGLNTPFSLAAPWLRSFGLSLPTHLSAMDMHTCVHGNMLGLAICKPRIRSTAEIGSFIVGIGGKPLGVRLIYIACITGKVVDGLYYRATCFRSRPDCIYKNVAGAAKIRGGAIFHKEGDQTKRDVGVHFED
jgi:hypothetical protein